MSNRRPERPAKLEQHSQDVYVPMKGTFQVVTPVFGGGVRITKEAPHHKEIDKITPVRGASVRGQLRFWWRATHGCTCASVQDMREREAAIWGSASLAGRVSLTIEAGVGACAPQLVEVYEQNGRTPRPGKREVAYGAFPLQPAHGAGATGPGVLYRLSGSYTLSLRVPKLLEGEVADALQAWLFFGNIGGRGRRGFGAVHPHGAPSGNPEAFLARFNNAETLKGVPSLHGARLVNKAVRPQATAEDAWAVALRRLQDFRQGEEIGRNRRQPEERFPGRSRWPEPELIREKTGQRLLTSPARLGGHPPLQGHPRKAPRAVFGLPIITHFKDGGPRVSDDPQNTKFIPVPAAGLSSKDQDRLASPLILRPIWLGGNWKAACLLLADPGRVDLRVQLWEDDTQRVHPVEWKLTPSEAVQVAPLHGLESNNILLAFLTFFAR